MLSITPKERQALRRVIEMYWDTEAKHFEEGNRPKDHIFKSFKALRRLAYWPDLPGCKGAAL